MKKRTSSYKRQGRGRKQPKHSKSTYALWGLVSLVCVIGLVSLAFILFKPFTVRLRAMYGDVPYPKGDVRGIDISHYQNDVDWEVLRNSQIKGAPVRFVFVKATEGKDMIDEYFNHNFYNAKENGLLRGAYHFFSPLSSAKSQAELFCRVVQLENGDLPPVLDVETKGEYSRKRLQDELKVWLRMVEGHYGVKPIIYTSYSFKVNNLNDAFFDDYPLWIAHYYIDSLVYEGDWSFWQHTDVGRVDGIDGYVDINIFNGTFEELVDMTIKTD